MVYRSMWAQPPRGSTEWAARQFYRLLENEERIAAERQQLRAMGWRRQDLSAGAEVVPGDTPPTLDEAHYIGPQRRQIDMDRALAARRSIGRFGDQGWEADSRFASSAPDQGFALAGYSIPQPGPGRPVIPNYLGYLREVPERSPANINTPPSGLAPTRTTPESPSSMSGEIPRPTFMNGSLGAAQGEQGQERAARHYYALLARQMRIEEQAHNRERALERLKARKASESGLQDEGQSVEAAGDDWVAAIAAWLPFISRDIPEDEDYCMRRWEAEQRRCGRWREDWARRGCLERARNRYMLCFGNGGMPDPREPDEWSEADMERWYNPDR